MVLSLLISACSDAEAERPQASSAILVAPEFTTYYAAFGGERIFGAPQTGPLINPETDQVIQYFTRMRLDFDPSLPPADQIQPYPLGSDLFNGFDETEIIELDANVRRRTFTGSNFEVADPFLTLYEMYDGELLFGKPISPRIWLGDVRTQYFENARLEWHPGFPEGERVQVGLLGQAHWLAEQPNGYMRSFTADPLAGLQAVDLIASVEYPLLYDDVIQLVHIKAMAGEQMGSGLAIELKLSDEAGTIPLGRTDQNGSLHATIPQQPWQAGEWVKLTILALNGDGEIIGERIVRFRKW